MTMKIQHRSSTLEVEDVENETIAQLAVRLASEISADPTRISLFILPKPGFLKHPFPDTPLSSILKPTSRIKLVGTPDSELKAMSDMRTMVEGRARTAASQPKVKANKYRDQRKDQEESQYRFLAIEPLNHLPNPERSRLYLERLAADPGIKAVMRKHKFTVGLLSELDPGGNSVRIEDRGLQETHLLGLNTNQGMKIELRLRTDLYDGYRDYKVIRNVLCHELTHNVHGPHDRDFWDLCKQLEKECALNDTLHGGHQLVAHAEFYNPDDKMEDADHADYGGWTGGEFILGSGTDAASNEGLTRREIMARAATLRAQKEKEAKEADAGTGTGKDGEES